VNKNSTARSGKLKAGVVMVDDQKMRDLNRVYRGEETTTDVLAFPSGEKLEKGILFLGEVVINLDQARRQAAEYGVSEKEEIARLITHGALHLLGYQDETKKERKEMEKIQERIVAGV